MKKQFVVCLLFFGFIPQILFPQFILERKALQNSEFTNDTQHSKSKDTQATLSDQYENYLRLRYPRKIDNFYIVGDYTYLERGTELENFVNTRLKNGSLLTSKNFPTVLTRHYLRMGLVFTLNPDILYLGYAYGNNGGARERLDYVQNSNYYDLTALYDYHYSDISYFRFGGYYFSQEGYDTLLPIFGFYYNDDNPAFRFRLLLGAYLRTYYDIDEHWGVNFKINNSGSDYRLNDVEFDNGLLTYSGIDYNFGVQYRFSKMMLLNFDVGIRTNRAYIFKPAHSADIHDEGVNTLNLKNAAYISIYFTLGPRDAPE